MARTPSNMTTLGLRTTSSLCAAEVDKLCSTLHPRVCTPLSPSWAPMERVTIKTPPLIRISKQLRSTFTRTKFRRSLKPSYTIFRLD